MAYATAAVRFDEPVFSSTRNVHGDRVGADEQRLRNVLVGLAAGEQLQDLELTRGQTGGIAREPQSITFAKRRNTLSKQDEIERRGYLLAFIEQRRRLHPVVPGATVQERGGIIVTRPGELGLKPLARQNANACSK